MLGLPPGAAATGRSVPEVERLISVWTAMWRDPATASGAPGATPRAGLGEWAAPAGVARFPMRIPSTTLSATTLARGLAGAESATR